jgi:hypothetical protein
MERNGLSPGHPFIPLPGDMERHCIADIGKTLGTITGKGQADPLFNRRDIPTAGKEKNGNQRHQKKTASHRQKDRFTQR